MTDVLAAPPVRPNDPVIRLDPDDNVVVAREDIPAGTEIGSEGVTTLADIPLGHKIATRPIKTGEPIMKYSTVIGFAGEDLAPGAYLHVHNVLNGDVAKDYRYAEEYRPTDLLPADQRATFMGIRRPDGAVGTRNYIGLFITVNCSATVARKVAAYFDEERLADYPNVDGVVAFVHEQGCGMELTGEPMDLLRRTLGGYIRHPNIAGAVVFGLGCERNNLPKFFEQESLDAGKMLQAVTMQHVGGTAAAIEAGKKAVREMLPARQRGDSASRARPSTSRSVCSAAGRTASPASRPIPRSARRSTSWCATAARRCSPKRPSSTASSTR